MGSHWNFYHMLTHFCVFAHCWIFSTVRAKRTPQWRGCDVYMESMFIHHSYWIQLVSFAPNPDCAWRIFPWILGQTAVWVGDALKQPATVQIHVLHCCSTVLGNPLKWIMHLHQSGSAVYLFKNGWCCWVLLFISLITNAMLIRTAF